MLRKIVQISDSERRHPCALAKSASCLMGAHLRKASKPNGCAMDEFAAESLCEKDIGSGRAGESTSANPHCNSGKSRAQRCSDFPCSKAVSASCCGPFKSYGSQSGRQRLLRRGRRNWHDLSAYSGQVPVETSARAAVCGRVGSSTRCCSPRAALGGDRAVPKPRRTEFPPILSLAGRQRC
jgi:hypothetical protein